MDDAQIQRKLNQMVKISNQLVDEAKARYGNEGNLFYEAEGGFHLMRGDVDGSADARQVFVEFSSDSYSRMGSGAW